MRRLSVFAVIAAALLPGHGHAQTADQAALLSRISLPPGFTIQVFAEVPDPRSLAVVSPREIAAVETVFVGSRRSDVHSLRDTDGDGSADEVRRRASRLNIPNGIATLDGLLYLALNDRVVRWPVPAEIDAGRPLQPLEHIFSGFPQSGHHGWRYAKFGPDRKLYVAVGAPCNVCALDGLAGKIVRMDPDGANLEIVADGVRNSVGFDWHPLTGDLFFTDNGADGMGDDIPADELNRVTRAGQHFGFPFFGGADVPLPGGGAPDVEVTAPVIEFQAHTANLGMHFYGGDMFPAGYRNDAFVAQHGSWNRSEPVGYRIMRIRFDAAGNPLGKQVFADGWLANGATHGRPVDIAELGDGSLLVSDDFANVVYRISYTGD